MNIHTHGMGRDGVRYVAKRDVYAREESSEGPEGDGKLQRLPPLRIRGFRTASRAISSVLLFN